MQIFTTRWKIFPPEKTTYYSTAYAKILEGKKYPTLTSNFSAVNVFLEEAKVDLNRN